MEKPSGQEPCIGDEENSLKYREALTPGRI